MSILQPNSTNSVNKKSSDNILSIGNYEFTPGKQWPKTEKECETVYTVSRGELELGQILIRHDATSIYIIYNEQVELIKEEKFDPAYDIRLTKLKFGELLLRAAETMESVIAYYEFKKK